MLFIRQEHIMRYFLVLFGLISLLPVSVQGKYHLTGSEEPIKAQVGSNVVLPCLVEPAVNMRDATVNWMFDSSKTVHLFRHEADHPESQDDRYKDRTYLNHAMLELGDVSLKLSNITKNDEGIYSCFIRRLPGHNKLEKRHVTLIVVDGKENENPDRHSGGKYHLVVPEGPIKAQVGSNVVLPCRVEPTVNAREATVEWMFDSSKTVHLFRNEADDPESQDDRYKDRTTLNHAMLEHGDVSLKLSKVTKNDEGIYSCFVRRLPDLSEERHVTLIVVDGKENENPDRHSGGPDPGVNGGVNGGVNVGLVVGALIIILAFITICVVRRHRGKQIFSRWNNKSHNEQGRNDEDHRGNGNQGDGAEKMPLQNLGKSNQNV